MGFDLVFFQAVDKESGLSASLAYILLELLLATLFTVLIGWLLRFIPPWWAGRELPRTRQTVKTSREDVHKVKKIHHVDNTLSSLTEGRKAKISCESNNNNNNNNNNN
ncbi:uncharacterized protein TM35_000271950, partial [Trypanosoma theileri]